MLVAILLVAVEVRSKPMPDVGMAEERATPVASNPNPIGIYKTKAVRKLVDVPRSDLNEMDQEHESAEWLVKQVLPKTENPRVLFYMPCHMCGMFLS